MINNDALPVFVLLENEAGDLENSFRSVRGQEKKRFQHCSSLSFVARGKVKSEFLFSLAVSERDQRET